MAEVTVTINRPSQPNADKIVNVQGILDAGNDAVFQYADETDATIELINLAADGQVTLLPVAGGDDADRKSISLVKGGWHEQKAHKIYSADTDASLGIRVRVI